MWAAGLPGGVAGCCKGGVLYRGVARAQNWGDGWGADIVGWSQGTVQWGWGGQGWGAVQGEGRVLYSEPVC